VNFVEIGFVHLALRAEVEVVAGVIVYGLGSAGEHDLNCKHFANWSDVGNGEISVMSILEVVLSRGNDDERWNVVIPCGDGEIVVFLGHVWFVVADKD
jgi:hypothetical protein